MNYFFNLALEVVVKLAVTSFSEVPCGRFTQCGVHNIYRGALKAVLVALICVPVVLDLLPRRGIHQVNILVVQIVFATVGVVLVVVLLSR